MALGRLIVDQLNLDPGVDTLGRWMAHHVAELLTAVNAAPTDKLRRERQNEAVRAIIRLWAHRSTYENRVNPLTELKPIIQVIRTLDSGNQPWLVRNDGIQYVYETFRRLMICLLLQHAASIKQISRAISLAKKTSQFQSDDERELVAAINVWVESVGKLTKGEASRRRSSKASVKRIDLNETVYTLIDEARNALNAVAEEMTRARTRRGAATGAIKATSNVMAEGVTTRSVGSNAKVNVGKRVRTRERRNGKHPQR